MRRGPGLAALVVLTQLAGGCGGEAPGGLGVRFASAALLERAARVAVYFYAPSQVASCAEVRAIVPRPPPSHGPFLAVLDDEGREAGIKFERTDILAGSYLVWADALGASGELIGSGCSPDQRVVDGKSTRILVVINTTPP